MIYDLTFNDIIKKNAKENEHKFAIITPNEEITFGDLDKKIDATASNLISLGLKPDDHVAIWGENSIQWIISFFAVIKAGGIAVLFNYSLPVEEINSLIEKTNISLLLYGKNKITKDSPDTPNLIAKKNNIKLGAFLMDNVILEKLNQNTEFFYRDCQETSFIIFSTGTTSIPKAIMLHQRGIINDVYKCLDILDGACNNGFCCVLPFFHSFGLFICIYNFILGTTLYTLGQFHPHAILNLIWEHKLETLASVSTVYSKLVEEKEFDTKVAPYIKYGIIGGGTTNAMQFLRLEANFNHAHLLNGYGMTECSPVISIGSFSDPLEIRARAVGKPIKDTEVKIYDSQKGFLPNEEIGEIVIKGFNVMNGYYNVPDENQPFDNDGWFHTGDLGKITEDGFIELAGRIKDIIIKGGENLNPLEIEKEIINFKDVENVKVLGAKNSVWGESIEACILTKNPNLDIDEIQNNIKTKLGTFKVPSDFFLFDSFPLNENGKLDVRSLQARMLNRLMTKEAIAKLTSGIQIMNTTITNTVYMISPIATMIGDLASYMKFTEKKILRIKTAIEEMLTERILYAYSDTIGKIEITVFLMNEWLRICFKDNGSSFDIGQKDRTDFSAIILLNAVDNYSFEYIDNHNIYALDFIYSDEFNIQEFIVANNKAFLD